VDDQQLQERFAAALSETKAPPEEPESTRFDLSFRVLSLLVRRAFWTAGRCPVPELFITLSHPAFGTAGRLRQATVEGERRRVGSSSYRLVGSGGGGRRVGMPISLVGGRGWREECWACRAYARDRLLRTRTATADGAGASFAALRRRTATASTGWKLGIGQAQLVQFPPELCERCEAQAVPPIISRASRAGSLRE
jgi:hypothetical protein